MKMKTYPKKKDLQRSKSKVKKKTVVRSEESDSDLSEILEVSKERHEIKLESKVAPKSDLTDLFETPMHFIGDTRRRPRTELI